MPTCVAEPKIEPIDDITPQERWHVFLYSLVSLFSLKVSRATSTAGKTLTVPTPYAIKMAFVDVALRHGLFQHPERLIRGLARASLRIGVPQHACVTGTIQTVRQETRESDRKQNPHMPFYRSSIAMREVVHYQGTLRVAFERASCDEELSRLLIRAAPVINCFGKRGSFFQYRGSEEIAELDATFSEPIDQSAAPEWGHMATLDDFGPKASFAALNSYSSIPIERGIHRKFVDTMIPLGVYNSGPAFVHYCAPGAMI